MATPLREMRMKKAALATLTALPFLALEPGIAQPVGPTETVKVQAAPMPDEVVRGFVKTFTAPSLLTGKIPRWAKGICLKTQGLPRELADAVTRRVLEVAEQVGAPVQAQPCALNTVVIFDANPQSVMDDIAAQHDELLGVHDPAQARELAKVRFPIQAWYATETQDNKGVNTADSDTSQSPLCESVLDNSMEMNGTLTGGLRINTARYSQVIDERQRYCGRRNTAGSRVRDGVISHLAAVTVVASMDTVNYHELGAVADYLALVILSQTKAFETCEKMETVANLLVPRCDLNNRVTGLMPGDIAFLKALYRADSGGTLVAQQAAIAGEMKKLLSPP
jgi:hypothetical protein